MYKSFLSIVAAIILAPIPCMAGDWGLVKISVASLRTEPRQSAELDTQALMGTPLRLLDRDGEWVKAELPDGCIDWINESGFVEIDSCDYERWRQAERHVVTSLYEIKAYSDSVSASSACVVTDLVNGCIVESDGSIHAGRMLVRLPDGTPAYADPAAFEPLAQWVQEPYSVDKLMDMAYSMTGTPYLWGGTSTKLNDCSGFTRICYLHAAKALLPRNASQQALVGTAIYETDSLRRGDLLFFLNPSTGRVNHVGIYDADGYFIHSSGRVKVNHLDPSHPDFCHKVFSHAVRLYDGDTGRALVPMHRIADSQWYF